MNTPARDAPTVVGGLRPGHGQVFLGTAADIPARPDPEQLAHIYRLGDPALSELGLEELLNELLMRAVEILRVDTAAILLHDEATGQLVARAAKGLEEEVQQGVRIPVGGGFAGRIAAGRVPIYIADVDHAEVLNPILREKGIRSMLGVPLVAEGALLGVLHVGSLVPRVFTNDDAVVLQLAAARAAPAIERARLFETLQREHRAAVGLQRSLLPDRLPLVTGVGIAARYLPSRDEVGGDWYDVITVGRGALSIAVGDVAGHGVRAAALMSELRSAARAYALEGHPPAEVLARTDRMLRAVRDRGMATAIVAAFDRESGALRYALAGHPPPVIVGADGRATMAGGDAGPPLGVVPHARYREHELELSPGATLLLYTDGLVERRGEPLSAGLRRLLEAAAGATSAEAACAHVVDQLVPPEGTDDDVAIVAVHNEPIATRLALELPARPDSLFEVRVALRRWMRTVGIVGEDVGLITLAVGEACANATEHAYAPAPATYRVEASLARGVAMFLVADSGRWRPARGRDRGRGLTIMRNAMDEVEVRQTARGTKLLMRRRVGDAGDAG